MRCRRLPWVVVLFLFSWALAPTAAHACTGFLVKEELVKSKRGGHTRLCTYDHLGDVFVTTVPSHAFCKVTIDVRHDNEDRDGDGVEDDEEGEPSTQRSSGQGRR
jgi:hypothetical protein